MPPSVRYTDPTPAQVAELTAVVEGYRDSVREQQWQQAGRYLTDKCVGRIVAALLFASMYAVDSQREKLDSFFELLDRHGLPHNTRGEIPIGPELPKALAELIGWMVNNVSDQTGDIGAQFSRTMAKMDFLHFRLAGDDRAAGTFHDGRRSQRIKLLKNESGWLIDEL